MLPRDRDYGRRRLTGSHSSFRGHSFGSQPGHLPVEIRPGLLFEEGGFVPRVAVDHAQERHHASRHPGKRAGVGDHRFVGRVSLEGDQYPVVHQKEPPARVYKNRVLRTVSASVAAMASTRSAPRL